MEKAKRQSSEKVMKVVFLLCAMFSVAAIVVITAYLLISGIPAILEIGLWNFLTGKVWQPNNPNLDVTDKFGILPMIVGSLYVTAGAVIIGVTIGVFSAIFITKFCPKKLKPVIKQIMNLLAGLPSIIYGFFGMTVIVPQLFNLAHAMGIGNRVTGNGVLACSIVLGIMILPTIVSISCNSLDGLPSHYYEGAIALGATKEQAVFRVLLPAAKSGIFAGAVLGIGRALGETMAVVLVCGGSAIFPETIFHNLRTLTANIVMEMSYAEGLHREALIATGVVLFVFILILNVSLSLIKNRGKGGK